MSLTGGELQLVEYHLSTSKSCDILHVVDNECDNLCLVAIITFVTCVLLGYMKCDVWQNSPNQIYEVSNIMLVVVHLFTGPIGFYHSLEETSLHPVVTLILQYFISGLLLDELWFIHPSLI